MYSSTHLGVDVVDAGPFDGDAAAVQLEVAVIAHPAHPVSQLPVDEHAVRLGVAKNAVP